MLSKKAALGDLHIGVITQNLNRSRGVSDEHVPTSFKFMWFGIDVIQV